MMPWLKLDPSWLPPGTEVGPWKVQAHHGGGAFGVVFRAVLAAREHGGPVALKVACSPWDPRFRREVELLSRIEHPSVPRLLGQGEWKHPDGTLYPYLVMEWVEGVPLYEWAARFKPPSREVLRVLAQVGWALEATHAVGGVHRDVKGDNIQVSPTGSRAFLTDYGAGHYVGAAPLTREGFAPGTPNYRSPEAWEFALHRPRNAPSAYKAQPADDVFALGVSAYRCVTGEYPPPVDVREEETGPGQLVWTAPRPPRELNPRVSPELSALILRMLSQRPEERPAARELAEALAEAAKKAGPEADRSLFAPRPTEDLAGQPPTEQPQGKRGAAVQATARWRLAGVRVPAWMAACAVLGGLLGAVAVGWGMRSAWDEEEGVRAPGPVGVGDTSLTLPVAPEEELSSRESLGLPMPDKPLEGQRRAPHCRPPGEVAINGGCWIAMRDMKPPCGDLFYEWKGGCYVPHHSRSREPTSEPR